MWSFMCLGIRLLCFDLAIGGLVVEIQLVIENSRCLLHNCGGNNFYYQNKCIRAGILSAGKQKCEDELFFPKKFPRGDGLEAE